MRVSTIRWIGSKSRHLDFILPLLPQTRTYVEPFGGSAAVLLNRPRSEIEVYNDLYKPVVCFFRALQDDPVGLTSVIHLTPHSRSDFRQAMSVARNPDSERTMEVARCLYVLAAHSYGGVLRTWGRQTAMTGEQGSYKEGRRQGLKNALSLNRRIKDVIFESQDALSILYTYDSVNTLFYLDPPYVQDSRAGKWKSYQNEYGDKEHRLLAKTLRSIKGKVAISGYDSDLYNDLYRPSDGWFKFSGMKRKIMVKNERADVKVERAQATEVLWTNYKVFE